MSVEYKVLVKRNMDGVIEDMIPGRRGRPPVGYVSCVVSEVEAARHLDDKQLADMTPIEKKKRRQRKAKDSTKEKIEEVEAELKAAQAKAAAQTSKAPPALATPKRVSRFEDALEPLPAPDASTKVIKASKQVRWTVIEDNCTAVSRTLHGEGEIVTLCNVVVTGEADLGSDYLKFNMSLSAVVGNLKTGEIHVYVMDRTKAPNVVIQGALLPPTQVSINGIASITGTCEINNISPDKLKLSVNELALTDENKLALEEYWAKTVRSLVSNWDFNG